MSKHDIFISYSRADKDIVNDFKLRLENEGWSVWMDLEGIESGEAFKSIIVEAIKTCKVVVFFSSKSSNASTYTAKEINLAVKNDIPIIPVLLDYSNYNPGVEFDLGVIDYIDYVNPMGLNVMTRLVKAVQKHLETEEYSKKNGSDGGGFIKKKVERL